MSRHLRVSGHYTYCGLNAHAVKCSRFKLLITCQRCYDLERFYGLLGIQPQEWQYRLMIALRIHEQESNRW